MTLYQRVRRQSTRLSVVDTREVAINMNDVSKPVSQVNINSGDIVTSTLNSAERTRDTLQRTDDVTTLQAPHFPCRYGASVQMYVLTIYT